MAQVRIAISDWGRPRLAATVGMAVCAALAGCFGGPGLEPPDKGGGPRAATPTMGGIGGTLHVTETPDFGGSGGTSPVPPSPSGANGGEMNAGGAGSTVPQDAGGAAVDAGPDASTDAGALSCDDIEAEFQAELARVQDCSHGEACTHSSLNAGCIGTSNNGLLPLCGLAHREGADLSALLSLDDAYGGGACYTGPIVCAACVQPNPACVQGRCTQQ